MRALRLPVCLLILAPPRLPAVCRRIPVRAFRQIRVPRPAACLPIPVPHPPVILGSRLLRCDLEIRQG
jgi:hypothetical protein